MTRIDARPAAALVLAGLIAGCSASASGGGLATGTPTGGNPAAVATATADASASASTDLLTDLQVNGRSMHLLCVGPTDTGKPTVIFESGLGGDAGQWGDVIHELAGATRACAYDRAGDGQSEPVGGAAGRTTKDQVADLRALLAVARIPPPYVLVGYSVGGWNVMVHADEHPDDVAGAVLVDTRPPLASQRWAAALPPEASGEPEAIHATRTDPEVFEKDPSQNPEGLLLAESAAQAQATSGFGAKPLVVLAAGDTSGVSAGFDTALGQTMVDIYWELQADLAARSSKGRLVKVDGATHEMPFERADAVAGAIREVLGGPPVTP